MRLTPMLSSPDPQELAALANKVIQDPKLLEQLTERVQKLLQENLSHQYEQIKHYKGGRSLGTRI